MGSAARRAVGTLSDVTGTQRLLRSWRTARALVGIAFFLITGGWLLLLRPGLNAGPTGVVMPVTLFVVRYLAFWALVWLLVLPIDRHLLVSSRTVQTTH